MLAVITLSFLLSAMAAQGYDGFQELDGERTWQCHHAGIGIVDGAATSVHLTLDKGEEKQFLFEPSDMHGLLVKACSKAPYPTVKNKGQKILVIANHRNTKVTVTTFERELE